MSDECDFERCAPGAANSEEVLSDAGIPDRPAQSHVQPHAFASFNARQREGLVVAGRRGMLKAGLAGFAGLSLPGLLRTRALAAQANRPIPTGKSVILLWMAGGPSQIDTWDPKPDRPLENRGPFGVISTKLPGVIICEHMPKQAAMLDKLTILRSVNPQQSNHEPNKVFQTGNLAAAPRINPRGDRYPAIGSIVAKHHGANKPGIPPYAAFMKSRSHLAYAGYLGQQYDPFIANRAAKLPIYDNVGVDTGKISDADLFRMHQGITHDRIEYRMQLLQQLDRLRRNLDESAGVMDAYQQQAMEMILGGRMRADSTSTTSRKKYAISTDPTFGAKRRS